MYGLPPKKMTRNQLSLEISIDFLLSEQKQVDHMHPLGAGFEMMGRTTFIPFNKTLEVLSEWYLDYDIMLPISAIFCNHDLSFSFSEVMNCLLSSFCEISTAKLGAYSGVLRILRDLSVL